MTANEKKQIILKRVEMLNNVLGEDYKVDYQPIYGGWAMYKVNPINGGEYRDLLGFDCRKSHDEMMNYLYGIMTYMRYIEVKSK